MSMSSYSRGPGGTPPSTSPVKMGSSDVASELASSSNHIAAGVGEILQALAGVSGGPSTKPIMIEFVDRTMALGRKRMAAMNGRNAIVYMKSKFGLLNSTSPFYLQASFIGDEESYVEVDLDAWEELVPHISRLRILN
ncbi:hypothetical protein BDQ17DRAFT_1343989 [Cyathus striatus]|nr:hypothetical protein BDQ17DRAFT_1343989 [Cyathus striatus]